MLPDIYIFITSVIWLMPEHTVEPENPILVKADA